MTSTPPSFAALAQAAPPRPPQRPATDYDALEDAVGMIVSTRPGWSVKDATVYLLDKSGWQPSDPATEARERATIYRAICHRRRRREQHLSRKEITS